MNAIANGRPLLIVRAQYREVIQGYLISRPLPVDEITGFLVDC